MALYRVTLSALAKVTAVVEVEAMSPAHAKVEAGLDQKVSWTFKELFDEPDIVVTQVDRLSPIEPKEQAEDLIRQHFDSVKGRIIYARAVLAFDMQDNRDERIFDPPIPFYVRDRPQSLTLMDRGDWLDSEYEVEPMLPDPRIQGLRTFDVDGRCVSLMTNSTEKPFLHCDDPAFVVVGG